MSSYYDRQGRPLTYDEARPLYARGLEYERVAFTDVDDQVCVSTIWIGLDHRIYGEGPPLIFETRIMRGVCSMEDTRSSTEEEALACHEAALARAQAAADALRTLVASPAVVQAVRDVVDALTALGESVGREYDRDDDWWRLRAAVEAAQAVDAAEIEQVREGAEVPQEGVVAPEAVPLPLSA